MKQLLQAQRSQVQSLQVRSSQLVPNQPESVWYMYAEIHIWIPVWTL